jgi:hypothetical protein
MTTMKNNLTDYREHVQAIEAEYDEEGIFVYQAFKHSIADFAIEHQRFGGEDFNPNRMVSVKKLILNSMTIETQNTCKF